MSNLWPSDMDAKLRKAIRREGSVRAAARALGVSECAAIARSNRMRGKIFPSDQKRRVESNVRRARERDVLDVFRACLGMGFNRNAAIRQAWDRGARGSKIAIVVGLSQWTIYRIVKGGRE